MVSLTVWWALIALVLWLVGQALDQPAMLAQCIASAAFLVAIGETDDWLRRRWRADPAERCGLNRGLTISAQWQEKVDG
ncbi:hypothetical protein [Streptomyces sp. NPDC006527]|uniref:hypothetical protein n=1 Tax=Streptomyces sp. NPDC006527 TaxID=3364749 RepID=UPI0036876A87